MKRDIELSQDEQLIQASASIPEEEDSRNHSINSEVPNESEKDGSDDGKPEEQEYIPLDTEVLEKTHPNKNEENKGITIEEFEPELDDSDDGFSQILVEPRGFK